MPWAILWWEYKPTQCSRKSFTYVSSFSCNKVHLLSMKSNWYRPQGSISPFTIYLPVGLVEEQGWGTNLRSQAAWIVHFRLGAKKSINFIPKLYFYLSMRKNDLSGRSIYKYLLIMDHQFDAMLCTTLSNDNSYADHIKCSHGPHLACGP